PPRESLSWPEACLVASHSLDDYKRRMRELILGVVFLGVLSVAAALPVHKQVPVPVTVAATPVAPSGAELPPSESPPLLTDTPSPDQARLEMRWVRATHLRGVMDSWPHASSAVPTIDYDELALDIAEAAELPDDGILLAGLAYFEGARF